MNTDSKLEDVAKSDKRKMREEALDDALKNTFPASDPVSVEQINTVGHGSRQSADKDALQNHRLTKHRNDVSSDGLANRGQPKVQD